jgi:hypothetical protein
MLLHSHGAEAAEAEAEAEAKAAEEAAAEGAAAAEEAEEEEEEEEALTPATRCLTPQSLQSRSRHLSPAPDFRACC